MSTIYNDRDYVFTPNEQQAIRNSLANYGVDYVYVFCGESSNNFYFFADEDYENYLFSIDINADGGHQIYQR